MSAHCALYRGRIGHRRLRPRSHAFRFGLYMAYLDLDEIHEALGESRLISSRGFAPLSFRRSDHLGDPATPLADAVRELVRSRTGRAPQGPIRLLTHLRHFNYVFNPLSLYYCFDAAGRAVEFVVGDVSNTPWGERHRYVLEPRRRTPGSPWLRARHGKEFHVSPFMPMDLDYSWSLTEPGERLAARIACSRESSPVFSATMVLERRPWSAREIRRSVGRFPLMSWKVIAAIHWEALRLWLKRVPVHGHPGGLVRPADAARGGERPEGPAP